MTSDGFELAALKSWQEAFEYPLGTTRQIEHALRAGIANNRDRLRTLVGASYRDLLSTAERITYLDGSIRETEVLMSTLSRNCNSDAIEKCAEAVAQLKREEGDKRSGGRAIAAQILLLQKCRFCVARLLRDHESSLLAAKVLSISRLLLKTLGRTASPLPVLDTLRAQLASLRRHLLRRLDQRLSNLDSSLEQLVEAICAFCLATSSSSSEALRHYHHLRLQEIRRILGHGESEHHNVVQAFRYYTGSLRTTKALLGRPLSEALRKLGAQSILRDSSVHQLDELDLSTLQRWVAVEIQDFVPFIKHNAVTGSEIGSLSFGWSKDAFNNFIMALKHEVESMASTSHLLDLRRELLETWLPICISTPVQSNSEILDTLRDVLNRRIIELIVIETASLADIGNTVARAMGEYPGHETDKSPIWDEAFVTMPIGKGASAFKQQLRTRYLGITESISSILRLLDAWIEKVRATGEVIQQLRKNRWQDLVEEDEGDEEAAIRIERILRSDDPNLYEMEHVAAVAQALADFQLNVTDHGSDDSDKAACQQVLSLLRIIRETCQRLHQAFPETDLATLEATVPSLQSRLALDVATKLLPSSSSGLTSQRLSHGASSHLWEGVPPLPVQPSPHIFKALHKLSDIMAELGADLWTQAAVNNVKEAVGQRLADCDLFSLQAANLHGNGLTNGAIPVNGETPKRLPSAHLSRTQDLFDVLYLNYALAPKPGKEGMPLAATVGALSDLLGLEESDFKALSRRAKDYWAKTNLLFGLLA